MSELVKVIYKLNGCFSVGPSFWVNVDETLKCFLPGNESVFPGMCRMDVTCWCPGAGTLRSDRRRCRSYSTSSPTRDRPQNTSPVLHMVITKCTTHTEGTTFIVVGGLRSK